MGETCRTILRLDRYGLTPAALFRLGEHLVRVRVHLAAYEVTPSVVRLRPSECLAFVERRATRWLATVRRRWRSARVQIPRRQRIPTEFSISLLAARDVRTLLSLPGERAAEILSIAGLRRRRRSRPQRRSWFCVRARVAVEIEGQRRGLQTIEDRFVLVTAASESDAVHRLARHWREYATPYLNSEGRLVRWHSKRSRTSTPAYS